MCDNSKAIKATAKEKSDILLDQVEFHFNLLNKFAFQNGLVVSVIIGWIVTSDHARDFLSEQPIKGTIIVGVILYTIAYSIVAFRIHLRSELSTKQLQEIGYYPFECVKSYRLSLISWIIVAVIQVILSSVLCILVWELN